MKIVLDLEENLDEDIIHIRCKHLSKEVIEIQQVLEEIASKRREITVTKEDVEYYITLDKVLFFETSGREIMLHTEKNSFIVKYKLYELEALLPSNFSRVSKSCIINIAKVYSIHRNSFSNAMIAFHNSLKQVSVSRSYYKDFKFRMDNRR